MLQKVKFVAELLANREASSKFAVLPSIGVFSQRQSGQVCSSNLISSVLEKPVRTGNDKL